MSEHYPHPPPVSLRNAGDDVSREKEKKTTREKYERNGCGNARCTLTKRSETAAMCVRVGCKCTVSARKNKNTRSETMLYSDAPLATATVAKKRRLRR